MKLLTHKVTIILAIGIALLFLFWPSKERGPSQTGRILLPWQMELTAQGHVQVMGLEIGGSTLTDARKALGSRGDVALFQDHDGRLSVEGFFSEVTSGGLSGRIIVALDIDRDELYLIAERADKRMPTETGITKLRPHWQDLDRLADSLIKSVTYIPYIDLDDAVIRARFGQPEEVVAVDEQRSHYLYPDKGLDILLDGEGKEVVQYVNPADFAMLVTPLKSKTE